MSAKQKFAEGFNDWLVKLFRELVKMYPQNKDFKNAKNEITILSQSPQYEMIIQYYEEYVSPYRQYLRNRDEQFFLEFDLASTKMEFLNYLKDLWKCADNETKETLWKYFQIFDKLSEKYHSL